MKPPAIAVAVALVSDRNVEAVLGLAWRPFRRWAEQRGIAVHKVGRRPCVRLDQVLEALGGNKAIAQAEEGYDEDAVVVELAQRRGRR